MPEIKYYFPQLIGPNPIGNADTNLKAETYCGLRSAIKHRDVALN